MPDFVALKSPAYSPGIVLGIDPSESNYLRLTHVFDDCVYAIRIKDASYARTARRPFKLKFAELAELERTAKAGWGILRLPEAMLILPAKSTRARDIIDNNWDAIAPLIKEFEQQKNLERDRYSLLIRRRANMTHRNFSSIYRLVIRYYYFGFIKNALISLPPGASPNPEGNSTIKKSGKRRARQPAISLTRGRNDFVVTDDDISDMIAAVERCARKPTFLSQIHISYLAHEFRKRHRTIQEDYVAEKIPEPVTLRQFRYYIKQRDSFDEDTKENLGTRKCNPGFSGALYASGPGEVYEIDATGGRLHLRSARDRSIALRTPIIYLIIDRWSRYVVSAYISLAPASYEELKYALLIAFTSRVSRFRILGVNVDDRSWPPGVLCVSLVADRGSELISESMIAAVTDSLGITASFLPPLTPDGKAIIERFIETLKHQQAAEGVPGSFMDRPLDPKSRRRFERAKEGAINSLAEAYRTLIAIIVEYNNTPHRSLRSISDLVKANIAPTPQAAYEWGLEHISGLRRSPLSDKDVYKMLLATCKASIGQGVLRFDKHLYNPVNETAHVLAQSSTHKFKATDIRIDRTNPVIAYISRPKGPWAEFCINQGGLEALSGTTLDEIDAFSSESLLLFSEADQKARARKVKDEQLRAKQKARAVPASKASQTRINRERKTATNEIKAALRGGERSQSTPTSKSTSTGEARRKDDLLKLVTSQFRKRTGGDPA